MNKEIAWLGLKSYLLNYADNETGRQYYISENVDSSSVEMFAHMIIEDIIKLNCENDSLTLMQKVSFENTIRKHFGIL